MKANEIINESLSRIAYHYTGVTSALTILRSGQFQLSSTLGSVEQQYAPKGHPYFLSTTRTRHGGYHDIIGSQGVLFVLDGNWFNNHYISGPIDYWLNRNPSQLHHRSHEAEDRVFSREASIPIDGVIETHVYVEPDAEAAIKAKARQVLIASKSRGIKTYFYTDKQAWKNFNKNKQGDVSVLTGKERTGGYVSSHRGYLMPWIELLQAKNKNQLSKDADKLRYSLQYSYDKHGAAQGFANDMSNARKPNSGPDREHAVKIISFMRKNQLETLSDLVEFLANKWKRADEN